MEKKGGYTNTRGASEKFSEVTPSRGASETFSEVTPSRMLENALLKCSINIIHH